MSKMNKTEEQFLEFLDKMPSVGSEEELLTVCMFTMSEVSNMLLKHDVEGCIPLTATAAYLAVLGETYLKGCKDVEMASLSAKTHMIEKFKRGFSDD